MACSCHYKTLDGDALVQGIPLDLRNCMRFAEANGADYVMFDMDGPVTEHLPLYADGVRPTPGAIASANNLPVTQFIFNGTRFATQLQMAVDFDCLDDRKLVVDASKTPVLEDGDYDAPEGLWVGVGDAAVRIHPREDGLNISVFRNGEEDGECLSSILVYRESIQKDDSEESPMP